MKSIRRLAAIMFSDIVGYTALMGKNSSKALELVRINRDIQKPLVEKYGGKWLKEMGDGAMAQFDTALDAVNCAVEIQELARAKFDGKLRIGIHSGDITIENDEIYGDGVNVAARLESIADPGGIYISDSIVKAIRGQSDLQTKLIGELKLKNIDYGVKTYSVQGVGLPIPDIEKHRQVKGGFWAEVQRRGLVQDGAAYIVLSLLAILLLPYIDSIVTLPQWATKGLVGILIVGFPLAIYFAWTYEHSPEGSMRNLKRRNVLKAVMAYGVFAWVLLQILAFILPVIEAPDWVLKILILFLIIGFPIWLFIAWNYELTPTGLVKTSAVKKDLLTTAQTNKQLNGLILLTLLITVVINFLKPDSYTLKPDAEGKYSIAVLPFNNMSPDKENEWFSDAVTEDILTHLSKIIDLHVVSHTSVKQYKDSDKTIPEIAKELGVSYLVEGSVRQLNNEVLITAQLIDATDSQIWANTYEESLDDAFEIQQNVSKAIVKELQITLSPQEEKSLNTSSTNSPEALKLFLKGRDLAESRTEEGLAESIKYYQKAIELDPGYADAYAQIANSIHLQVNSRYINVADGENLIEANVAQALTLNPNTAEAYTTLGNENLRQLNFEKAEENYLKAIQIDPSHASAYMHLALLYRSFNDRANWLKYIREAARLDPLSPLYLWLCMSAMMANGELEEAERLFRDKGFILNLSSRTNILADITALVKKDWKEAITVYEDAIKDNPDNANLHGALGLLNWQIHHDADNFLEHAKIAYDIDPTWYNASFYLAALVQHKDYVKAEALFSNPDYLKSIEKDEVRLRGAYYYLTGDFERALQDFTSYEETFGYVNLVRYHISYKAFTLAALGQTDEALEIMNKYRFRTLDKAVVFAILEERDSMYQVLDKISSEKQLTRWVNGFPEFDPYRDEPAFKEFQKKNYLPVKVMSH